MIRVRLIDLFAFSSSPSGSHSSITGRRDTKRLRSASYQVCRSVGGRLRQRSRLGEQCDGNEGNGDQSATGDEHVTDIMSRGTCAHGCLTGLGHDRTFVIVHRTLLSHEPNRLTKRIGFPFQSRLKRRYKLESYFREISRKPHPTWQNARKIEPFQCDADSSIRPWR
jgi:hypothetical protein